MLGQRRRSDILQQTWDGGRVSVSLYKALLAQRIRSGVRILHAGCGWDKNAVTAPYRKACKVVGVDLDKRVSKRYHSTFICGSLDDLPFADSTFDLVLCENVVEHLENPERALRELNRVLRGGGRLLVLTPNRYSYKSFVARLTPHSFHIWMGRIRYGRGHEEDMYHTFYRCNTTSKLRALAKEVGFDDVKADLVTNGPTWFEKFAVVFDVFNVFHLAIRRLSILRQLRCAIVLDAGKPSRGARSRLLVKK